MPFSERVKKEVKEKSAFQCCRCKGIGIQVHHIIPEAEEGTSDDIDNAAPLCPSCHDYFGGNPDKRKDIREMRDWWYKIVEESFRPNKKLTESLAYMSTKMELISGDISENQEKRIKRDIVENIGRMLINAGLLESDKLQFQETVASTISAGTSFITQKDVQCKRCGYKSRIPADSKFCPKCGAPY